jgi:hypothetical protein
MDFFIIIIIVVVVIVIIIIANRYTVPNSSDVFKDQMICMCNTQI